MNVNPHSIEDGEELPCIGGPLNGQLVRVEVLFPFMDGGIPSRAYRYGGSWYELDDANRRWLFTGVDGELLQSR